MSEDAITSVDAAPKKQPTAFRDLSKDQLVAAANAFGTLDEGNKQELLADLEESGVTWKMYVKQFQLEGHEDIPDVEEVAPLQVDEVDLVDAPEGVEDLSEPVTAAPVELAPADKYLIKFIGENPYFEFGKYKFTQDSPYGVMPASDAQKALVNEPTKFRQAFPAELQDFYN